MKLPIKCFWIWSTVIVLALYGAQAELNFDKLDIQSQLPEDLAKSNFTYNDVKEIFRNKCIEVSGEEAGDQAYKDIESSFLNLTECMNGIVNFTALEQEIQEASPKGDLDVVFNKYCKRRTNAIECFDVFTTKLLPCLDKDEQESQKVIKRIVQSLLNFVCHKDGDQIALFIAESGPECLQSKRDQIQQCVNSTFSTYVNNSDIDLHDPSNKIKSIPKLVVGEKQCAEISTMQSCIVKHLERCSKITPANLVESMFNFIRNETVCRDYRPLPLTDNGSTIVVSNPLITVLMYCQSIYLLFKLYFLK